MPSHPDRVRRNYDGESMRDIYNRASAGTGLPNVVVLPCEACGDVVTYIRDEKTGEVMVIHEGCETPMVTMQTLNQRKLGVITGISE